jgi:hypothetical protein
MNTFNIIRKDSRSLNYIDILKVYENLFEESIYKQKSSFERKLGTDISSFIDNELSIELEKKGRTIGGKKGFGATKKIVISCLKKLANGYYASLEPIVPSDTTNDDVDLDELIKMKKRTSIECFIELFELDGVVFTKTNLTFENDEAEGVCEAESDEVLYIYIIYIYIYIYIYISYKYIHYIFKNRIVNVEILKN